MKRFFLIANFLGFLFLSGCDVRSDEDTANTVADAATSLMQTENLLVGTWASSTDEKYVLHFDENGETSEQYEGKETARGTWHVAQDASSPTGVIVRKDVDGERYIYSVLSISSDDLSLSYLPKGNTLNFKRNH